MTNQTIYYLMPWPDTAIFLIFLATLLVISAAQIIFYASEIIKNSCMHTYRDSSERSVKKNSQLDFQKRVLELENSYLLF